MSVYISCSCLIHLMVLFFFNDTATTEIYTLSLHDALPISASTSVGAAISGRRSVVSWSRKASRKAWRSSVDCLWGKARDRKSTRLNSSHANISYAVFCLKKKNKKSMILESSYRLERVSRED